MHAGAAPEYSRGDDRTAADHALEAMRNYLENEPGPSPRSKSSSRSSRNVEHSGWRRRGRERTRRLHTGPARQQPHSRAAAAAVIVAKAKLHQCLCLTDVIAVHEEGPILLDERRARA